MHASGAGSDDASLGRPQLESLEALLDLDDLNAGHVRSARTSTRPGGDRLQRVRIAVHRRLHRPIAAVPYPAGDTEPLGFVDHGVTESYALHSSRNPQKPGHVPEQIRKTPSSS